MSLMPNLSSMQQTPPQLIPTNESGCAQAIVQALAARENLPAPMQADIHDLAHDVRAITLSGVSDDDWATAFALHARRAHRILDLGHLLRSSDAILAL